MQSLQYPQTLTDHSQTVLQAAELAGLEVRDERGRLDDSILLSEPEAVMYYVQ